MESDELECFSWGATLREPMVTVSLVLNLLVLVPVCFSLLVRASWVDGAYGPESPARGILLSIYLAIGLASAGLLFTKDPRLAVPLLAVQVLYKVTTPFTVKTLRNPVVISNLLIAAVHGVTLFGSRASM